MRFHRHDSTDAVVTAALLCTDHRWRRGSHHLVHRLGDAGVLTARDVEALAEQFLSETLDIEVVDDSSITGGSGRLPDDSPGSIVSRPIWPPLRRWAAWQVVQRDPARWRELLAYADELPLSPGAAVAAGVLDAADRIPVADVRDVVTAGLAAGSGKVPTRRAADIGGTRRS